MVIMNLVFAIFMLAGAVDRILGNKFGLGKAFEKGICILGPAVLSMVGMIVMAPVVEKALVFSAHVMPRFVDPSFLPAAFFAIDMGGAPLCKELAQNEAIGLFNGLVTASMLGCTVSFTIPFAMSTVERKYHDDVLLGILCGIVTIPVGCFMGGIVAGIEIETLIANILPTLIVSAFIAVGLVKAPSFSVKVFKIIGFAINALVTIGLAVSVFERLTGIKLIPGAGKLEEAMEIITDIACVMAGVFCLLEVLSRLLSKPIERLGKAAGIEKGGAMGLVATLATSVTVFSEMGNLNRKARILNSAFAVSGAFVLADHLAYTLAFSGEYVSAMTVGKLCAAGLALVVAMLVYGKLYGRGQSNADEKQNKFEGAV